MSDSELNVTTPEDLEFATSLSKHQALLRETAFKGDTSRLKELLSNSEFYWLADAVYQEAFETAIGSDGILDDGEEVIKWWMVTSINSTGCFQERLLIVTTSHVIRVKYDFKKKVVERFEKTSLDEIIYVHHGKLNFTTSKFSPSAFFLKKEPDHHAVRIARSVPLSGPEDPTVAVREDDMQRTFYPIVGSNVRYTEEDVTLEIAYSMVAAKVVYSEANNVEFDPETFASNTSIQVHVKGGLFSIGYNSLGFGLKRT
ncbi:hypothetical protein P9112_002887 [Eukaryota sp. TZLM1-RC]